MADFEEEAQGKRQAVSEKELPTGQVAKGPSRRSQGRSGGRVAEAAAWEGR